MRSMEVNRGVMLKKPGKWSEINKLFRARDLKNSGKYGLGLRRSLGLIYDMSFWIQAASYFPQS